MKLALTSLLFALSVFSICCTSTSEEVETEVVIVRIPPRPDPKLTAGENHCVFYAWWHERNFKRDEVVRRCASAPLPNDGVPLIVMLDEQRSLRIQSEAAGTLSDTSGLTERLKGVFEAREQNAVYAAGTNEVERSVALVMPRSAKFRNVANLALVVRDSGATPIMLAIDNGVLLQKIDIE